MQNNKQINSKRRGQLIFCLIIAIFALPFVASTVLFNEGWSPKHHTNLGTLLTPPPQLPERSFTPVEKNEGIMQLRGSWWLVGVMPNQCAAACQKDLHQMRQIHVALGKSGEAVHRLWLSEKISPLPIPSKDAWRLYSTEMDIASIQTYFPGHEMRPCFYIVDPDGFVILRYSESQLGKDIQKDFTRLLKYSAQAEK